MPAAIAPVPSAILAMETAPNAALTPSPTEAGWVNSYHDDQVSFIDIIVPTELRNEVDPNGEIGVFSCSPQLNDYIVSISYQLPVSVEDLKEGRFNPERLAEMDYILTSLTWK